MEATKKKKAYLKPEMSRFEVKTQEFIAGSVIVDDQGKVELLLDRGKENCFAQGTQEGVAFFEGACFQMNLNQTGSNCTTNTGEPLGEYLIRMGFKSKHFYKITKIEGDNVYCEEVTICQENTSY